jgi:hypothetical protein
MDFSFYDTADIMKKLRKFHPLRVGVEYVGRTSDPTTSTGEHTTTSTDDTGAGPGTRTGTQDGTGTGTGTRTGTQDGTEGPSVTGSGGGSTTTTSTGGATVKPPPDPALPEGTTIKRNEDGSLEVTNAKGEKKTYEAGSPENPVPKTPENAPENETPPEKAANQESKSTLLEKLTKGAMLLPLLLPLALLLAGFIQGEIACNEINGSTMNITGSQSAQYPTGLPSWFPTINKTKVNLTYSPCNKILNTDTITIKDSSNILTGSYGVTGSPGACQVQIDIGKVYTSNSASNTATFTDKTSCSDRMAYAIGQDSLALGEAAGSSFGDILSGLFGNVPWSGIAMVVLAIIAVYFLYEAVT